MTTKNLLQFETSPYLKQHEENPVAWHPWNQETLKLAETEGKPIFLSIGYSTCYWCHVMEGECFEDKEVAESLNKSFISIKVDREERPDIDAIYMDAVIAISGHGGWPMSVFLTPDRKPFYGATYIPKPHFLQLLETIESLWENDRTKINDSATALFAEASRPRSSTKNDPQDSSKQPGQLDQVFNQANSKEAVKELTEEGLTSLAQSFDYKNGGFGAAPKFPPHTSLQFLASSLFSIPKGGTSKQQAETMLKRTMDAMEKGGIFDHVEGGFHRYSVDERWEIPHFEKMLYDNAQLLLNYSIAYSKFKTLSYKATAKLLVDFLSKEFRSPGGGFISGIDAGEVHEEGDYYGYTFKELSENLDVAELQTLRNHFVISANGNFERSLNILKIKGDPKEPYTKTNITLPNSIRNSLLEIRRNKKPLRKDMKIITAWNSLCIEALTIHGIIFKSDRAINLAIESADFILENLIEDEILYRTYAEKRVGARACADDYSFLISALITLYQIRFEAKYLRHAFKLQTLFDQNFWDEDQGAYAFDDGKDKTLITRKHELLDNATPSSNGVCIKNLVNWYFLTGQDSFQKKANTLTRFAQKHFPKHPSAFASFLGDWNMLTSGYLQISCTDKNDAIFLRERLSQQAHYSGFVGLIDHETSEICAAFKGKQTSSKSPSIFICAGTSCHEPASNKEDAAKLLDQLLLVNGLT